LRPPTDLISEPKNGNVKIQRQDVNYKLPKHADFTTEFRSYYGIAEMSVVRRGAAHERLGAVCYDERCLEHAIAWSARRYVGGRLDIVAVIRA
jgi:hypothetical protein